MFNLRERINRHAVKAMNKLVEMKANSMMQDKKAEGTIQQIIMAVLGIVIGVILISSLVPDQITTLEAVNTSTWGDGTESTFNAVSILFVVAVLMIPVAVVIKLTK